MPHVFPPDLAALLQRQGYIARDDGPADHACREILTAHMNTPGPDGEQVARIVAGDPAWQSMTIAAEPCDYSGRFPAWIAPSQLECALLDPTVEPWHHRRDQIVRYALVHAHDVAQVMADGHGLIVVVEALPFAGRFRSSVTTNGNHRALAFRALGLPLVPAMVSVVGTHWQAPWMLRRTLEAAAEHHLITLEPCPRPGYLQFNDPAGVIPWVLPHGRTTYARHDPSWTTQLPPDPAHVPDRITQLETYYQDRLDPAYDFLRRRGSGWWWRRFR